MTFHSVVPAPRTILAGVRKLPPATVRTIRPDGTGEERVYWRDAVLESLRVAVRRRMVADVPVGVLLSGGLDSSLVVALLAEEGQVGLKTFSVGFHAAAGESGDEFEYSDLIAKHFGTDHQQILVAPHRMLPAVDAAITAMNEPMVSHDCVAFYLLSEEVAKSVKVVQSGQGADEVFAGYSWYPPLAEVARSRAVSEYARVFTDRPHDDLAAILEPEWLLAEDPSRVFVAEHFARDGATDTLDAALRLDSTVMLVDDPVKRVDNMTMAWGLEARVPFLDHEVVELAAACPPALKLAHGGKGVLKEAARGVVPDAVIDRPKGYFPVPALSHLEGPVLELVGDALRSEAARERGLFREDVVEQMLAAPNEHRTNLDGSALWQLGLLELWLQEHVG
jgi:asparagine synthase (glutamine-hydrolysing)